MMPFYEISTLYKLLANILMCTFIGMPLGFISMFISIIFMVSLIAATLIVTTIPNDVYSKQCMLETAMDAGHGILELFYEKPQAWLMSKLIFKI